MSSLVQDLWPSDLVKTVPDSPITIMKVQALLLGGKTNGLVQGDVRPELQGRNVILTFELVMPLLENYRYPLFKVIYPADQVYPLFIRVSGKADATKTDTTIEDPIAFTDNLRMILNSDWVRTTISSFVDMQRPQSLEFETMG